MFIKPFFEPTLSIFFPFTTRLSIAFVMFFILFSDHLQLVWVLPSWCFSVYFLTMAATDADKFISTYTKLYPELSQDLALFTVGYLDLCNRTYVKGKTTPYKITWKMKMKNENCIILIPKGNSYYRFFLGDSKNSPLGLKQCYFRFSMVLFGLLHPFIVYKYLTMFMN